MTQPCLLPSITRYLSPNSSCEHHNFINPRVMKYPYVDWTMNRFRNLMFQHPCCSCYIPRHAWRVTAWSDPYSPGTAFPGPGRARRNEPICRVVEVERLPAPGACAEQRTALGQTASVLVLEVDLRHQSHWNNKHRISVIRRQTGVTRCVGGVGWCWGSRSLAFFWNAKQGSFTGLWWLSE